MNPSFSTISYQTGILHTYGIYSEREDPKQIRGLDGQFCFGHGRGDQERGGDTPLCHGKRKTPVHGNP